MKTRERLPLPFRISFDITFVDCRRWSPQWRKEVRKIVLKHLTNPPEDLWETGLWEEYDDRVWEIIREVQSERELVN